MAQRVQRLSAIQVRNISETGLHPDGGGLYLQVGKNGSKSWVLRFMLNGRSREMGLGRFPDVSLADARAKSAECRRLRLEGIDPIESRNDEALKARVNAVSAKTFSECAREYIRIQRPGWKSAIHAQQWQSTLDTYAHPLIGDLVVQRVDLPLILRVLEPIWNSKTETASRLRERIERILDWATTIGYRQGENPARWRGHMANLLPPRSKTHAVRHFSALPFVEIAPFIADLRTLGGIAPLALVFLILTASRTSETLGASWGEIDLERRVWTVPAGRIKAGKEHRVSLSAPALCILERMKAIRQNDYVFPGQKAGKPLSNMALLAVLERMGRGDITVHGFRSTFRDWAAECTRFERDVAEMALAHAIENKVEAAYRRGDLFEKRRILMGAWSKYCESVGKKGDVVPLTRKAG